MMAGDVYLPYHNDLIPEDTNQDYSISALDALVVINAINAGQLGGLSSPGVGKADGPMLDVSGDNVLSPLDALRVINRINGEGEVGDLVGFTLKLADQN
ncbi:MAG: dockerin type I domain-containing protein, partial [Aureliella sp.]